MLKVEEAQQRVLDVTRVLESESVPLTAAHGRVLREDVRAPFDVPERDNTAMDGYAVRADDVAAATAAHPVLLPVIDDLPAGSVPSRMLVSGSAIRIMTGALLPEGADAVVQVEWTDAGRDAVQVMRAVPRGANVRRQGEDMRAGDVVLHAGTTIRAGEIGVLAGVQRSSVQVGRPAQVAIVSTGDELVDINAVRSAGKVVNSNAYSLAALVSEAGAIPRVLDIVPDSREATIAALRSALTSDVVITSGGVSAGAWDFVKEALEQLGATVQFEKVAMKPGKPVVVSTIGDRLLFGLPGNPVSCMISFLLFVAPALRKMMGQTERLLPPVATIALGAAMTSKGDRRTYNRVRVVAQDGALVAFPMRAQGSGVSTSMLQANALAIMAPGVTRVEAGQSLPMVLIGAIV